MDEFENLFGKEFFVIDSNNLDTVVERLYGYAFQDGSIVEEDTYNRNNTLESDGAYVHITIDDDFINISQDNIGSYGLYVYEKDDYFAISNSFLKLVEYLENDYPMSFNNEYAEAFIFSGFCSFAYGETLVNEIEVIPSNSKIVINKKNSTLNLIKFDIDSRSIPINSKEGLEVLDQWYYKWVEIFRSIRSKTNNIVFALSGGMDSRLVSAIWLTANMDLNNEKIESFTDNNHVEDFQIASMIGREFGFELNNQQPIKRNFFKEINTPLNISFYTKLGFHNEFYFKYFRYEEPLFLVGGAGGESIRDYYGSPDEYIEKRLLKPNLYNPEFKDSTLRVVNSALDKARKDLNRSNDDDSKEIPDRLCKEVEIRNHFGKAAVGTYLSNTFRLAPINDNLFHKLRIVDNECVDRNLLIALVFIRYCPTLLNFKFDKNREIDKKTIEHAKMINNKFPFIKKDLPFVSGPKVSSTKKFDEVNPYESDVAYDLIRNVLNSRSFELEMKKYYSEKTYAEIKKGAVTFKHYPLKFTCAALSVLRVIYATNYRVPLVSSDKYVWLNSFVNEPNIVESLNPEFKDLLLKYATARIDIKNCGNSENNVELLENSDSKSSVTHPNWFKNDEGEGIVIESVKGSIDLRIKCVNKGLLRLWIKGPDAYDKNKNRFPIFIDFTKFTINGKDYLESPKLLTHDKSYRVDLHVNGSDIFDIHVEWSPFNKNSVYNSEINQCPTELKQNTTVIKEVEKLRRNLNNHQRQLDSYKKYFNTIFLDYNHTPNRLLGDIFTLCTELMIFVQNVCKKYNLEWWLDGGTLLGAVRHNNFIPWDDDVDLAMTREDYLKFDEVIKKEVKEHGLEDIVRVYHRIRDFKGSQILTFIQIFVRHKIDNGTRPILAGVDIFPFDNLVNFDESNFEEEYYNSKLKYFENLLNGNEKSLEILYDDLNLSFDKTEYIVPGVEGSFGPNNMYELIILKTQDIFPLKETRFGDVNFPIPNNSHNYLKAIYGDYMYLPKFIHMHNRVNSFRYNSSNEEMFKSCIDRMREANNHF